MLFLSIGECMVELSGAGEGLWRAGFAGDTLNTAWYARQALHEEWEVAYFTQLGRDPESDKMVDGMAGGGISTRFIGRHPSRVPGLYMIALSNGERSFTYWRDSSAAKCLADDIPALEAALAEADLVYVSGITLAILPADRRAAFLAALAPHGDKLAFDPNYRPRLWSAPEEAREAMMACAAMARFALPSHDDEAALFGDADPAATAARYLAAGTREVVVKNGGAEMVLAPSGDTLSLPQARPVDTTGAGDSFNAGYLAARLTGASPAEAARAGHAVALKVIAHPGALVKDLVASA